MKRLIMMALVLIPSLLVLSFEGISYAATTPKPAPAPPTGACGSVAGSSKDQVLQGSGQAGTTDCNGTSVGKLTSAIVGILSIIVGIAAVIVIIIAGFKYITSGGEASKIANAKTTLIYALVGLVVVALAQFIVHFTINTASTAATTASCPTGQTLSTVGTCEPIKCPTGQTLNKAGVCK